jgi:hypothetical protein
MVLQKYYPARLRSAHLEFSKENPLLDPATQVPFFSWTFGNAVTLTVLFAAIWRADTLIRRFAIEHEILVRDYCERHDLDRDEFVTGRNRRRRIGDK